MSGPLITTPVAQQWPPLLALPPLCEGVDPPPWPEGILGGEPPLLRPAIAATTITTAAAVMATTPSVLAPLMFLTVEDLISPQPRSTRGAWGLSDRTKSPSSFTARSAALIQGV